MKILLRLYRASEIQEMYICISIYLKRERDKIYLISRFVIYTYHSDMNVFLERFAVDGLRGAFVIACVVSAGLLYIQSSGVLEILDGGEIPVPGAPPDLTWHVQLA